MRRTPPLRSIPAFGALRPSATGDEQERLRERFEELILKLPAGGGTAGKPAATAGS